MVKCNEKCIFCRMETVGHGDTSWQCVITEYYAPLESECPYPEVAIEALSLKRVEIHKEMLTK